MQRILGIGMAIGLLQLAACGEDADTETGATPPGSMMGDDDGTGDGNEDGEGSDGTGEQPSAETRFRIRLENAAQYLAVHSFDTPDGANERGPLSEIGQRYVVSFKAVPGSRLSFANMLADSNDWFYTFPGEGVELFDADGAPVTGDLSTMAKLYDAGTEEEDPVTEGGKVDGPDDDDPRVRRQAEDVTADVRIELGHANDEFTLTIERVGAERLSPGIVVVHARPNPLFTSGEPDRGHGLALIAEKGDPDELVAYLEEQGASAAPLRLSSSLTPFSPGVAYVFQGDNPVFAQGAAVSPETGLENQAEDGDNTRIYQYLTEGGYTAVQSSGSGLPGSFLEFELSAKPGDMLNVVAMMVQSNDWFFSFPQEGVPLFEADGTPRTGTALATRMYLWDAGTEIDEPVGSGANQAPRQSGVNTGAADPDTLVRRVGVIEDMQFGKSAISASAGVASLEDPRGGYNLTLVSVEVVE